MKTLYKVIAQQEPKTVYNRGSISLSSFLSKYRAGDDDLEPSEVILATFPVFDPNGVKFGFSAWEHQNIAKKTFLRRTVPEKYLDLLAQFFLRVFLFFKKLPQQTNLGVGLTMEDVAIFAWYPLLEHTNAHVPMVPENWDPTGRTAMAIVSLHVSFQRQVSLRANYSQKLFI